MEHDAHYRSWGGSPVVPKKKGPRKPDYSEGGDPIPLHHRAMEKEIQEIGKQLRGNEFESMEEARAFLEELIASGEGLQPIPAEPSTPLEEAQELIYEAFETRSHRKRVQLAKKALKVSSDCADAYVLLAEETAKDPKEAKGFYEKGVQAGERALGEEAFEEDAGHFWGVLETRPYMRARQGLALALWELGERSEAIEHYRQMLHLNPNDNQGIRYLLASALLEEGLDDDLGELLKSYGDDAGANWVYARALWSFRTGGTERKREPPWKRPSRSTRLYRSTCLAEGACRGRCRRWWASGTRARPLFTSPRRCPDGSGHRGPSNGCVPTHRSG